MKDSKKSKKIDKKSSKLDAHKKTKNDVKHVDKRVVKRAKSNNKAKKVVPAVGIITQREKRILITKQRKDAERKVVDIAAKKAAKKAEDKKNLDKENIANYKRFFEPFVEKLLADRAAADYLKNNVGSAAFDVISLLKKPRSDEEIAKVLDTKINSVRRMLNLMQGYGITNYVVSKNKDGWLSFSWYIDTRKAHRFFDYVLNSSRSTSELSNESCNDYFICNKCYKENRLVLTFDAAYESSFRCSCDNVLTQISRDEVVSIINKENARNQK